MHEQQERPNTAADRAAAAQKWLRDFVTQNSSPAMAREQLSTLPPTAVTTELIEGLRTHIERQTRVADGRIQESQQATMALHGEYALWERAGAAALLSALDEDAVRETDRLVDACAALHLPPGRAARHASRVDAAARVTDALADAQVLAARRRDVLAKAQGVLRDTADALQQGKAAARQVAIDVTRRREQGVVHSERSHTFGAKVAQYDDAAARFEQQVKNTGVSARTTHEGVVADGNRLDDMEKRLLAVNQDLKRFHDLPADVRRCREMIAGMQRQIELADTEIQDELSSMMK